MLLIASVGVNANEQKIRKIILAGANVIRINFSRRNIVENMECVKMTRDVIADLNSQTKLLIDMPINKIRLGDFEPKNFAVREGEELIFQSASYSPDCNQFIPVQIPKLGEVVWVDQTITVGDGEVALQVTEIINAETVKMRSLNNGVLQYLKTFNLKSNTNQSSIITNYADILSHAKEFNPEYIAISYIDKDTNAQIKNIIDKPSTNAYPKIIVKIENEEGINHIEEIATDSFYDFILIDRGEMGGNLPFEQVGIQQKFIMTRARQYKKADIVSTQILESTINNYTPMRSDILDLTNIIIDGAKGIMFCRETGIATRPAYTISVAKKIIAEAEKYKLEQ